MPTKVARNALGNRHDFGDYEDIKENNLDVVLERVSNEGLTEKGLNAGQHASSWTRRH